MKTNINSSVYNINTGKTAYDFNPGLMKGYFLAPVTNCDISAANLLVLETFINAQLHNASPSLRWHHAGIIEGHEDQTEAATSQTLPNGRIVMTDRSHPMFEFQFLNGGKGYHQALQSFNGLEQYFRMFYYDGNNVLYGVVSEDDDAVMTGIDLSLHYTHDYKAATKTTIAEYKTKIQFADAAQMNEKAWHIKCGFNLSKLLAVRDVLMTDITPGGAAAGVFEVGFTEGNGNTNLLTILTAAVLADADNFTVKRSSTGAAIAFAVAANTAGTGVKFTLTTGDSNYLAGADAKIAMKDPAALGVLGLKWFEGRDADGNYYVEVEMT
jgi:hypothetical protein